MDKVREALKRMRDEAIDLETSRGEYFRGKSLGLLAAADILEIALASAPAPAQEPVLWVDPKDIEFMRQRDMDAFNTVLAKTKFGEFTMPLYASRTFSILAHDPLCPAVPPPSPDAGQAEWEIRFVAGECYGTVRVRGGMHLSSSTFGPNCKVTVSSPPPAAMKDSAHE